MAVFTDENWVFVDVQGFSGLGDTFILKEFALLYRDIEFHVLVKSPSKYCDLWALHKHEAEWRTYTHHGIEYDAGDILIDELVERTAKYIEGKVVIVKGSEQVQWIKDIYKDRLGDRIDCVNVEEYNPIFQFEPKTKMDVIGTCPHHRLLIHGRHCHCALSNVRELQIAHIPRQSETKDGGGLCCQQ